MGWSATANINVECDKLKKMYKSYIQKNDKCIKRLIGGGSDDVEIVMKVVEDERCSKDDGREDG